MDMGFLLGSSIRWSLFSISYSFAILLWQFANNITKGLYQYFSHRSEHSQTGYWFGYSRKLQTWRAVCVSLAYRNEDRLQVDVLLVLGISCSNRSSQYWQRYSYIGICTAPWSRQVVQPGSHVVLVSGVIFRV